MKNNAFTLGADPEFFVHKEGATIPAPYLLSGINRKNKASISLDAKNKASFFHDNSCLEINVTPANNKQLFIANISRAKREIEKNINVKLLPISSCKFHIPIPPEGAEFGCAPFFNIYREDVVDISPRIIRDLIETNTQHAGGHLHIGYVRANTDGIEGGKPLAFYLTAILDYLLWTGIWDPVLTKAWINAKERSGYGMLGSIRAKDYGFEYRPCGPEWTRNKNSIARTYDVVQFVINEHKNLLHSFPYSLLYDANMERRHIPDLDSYLSAAIPPPPNIF